MSQPHCICPNLCLRNVSINILIESGKTFPMQTCFRGFLGNFSESVQLTTLQEINSLTQTSLLTVSKLSVLAYVFWHSRHLFYYDIFYTLFVCNESINLFRFLLLFVCIGMAWKIANFFFLSWYLTSN